VKRSVLGRTVTPRGKESARFYSRGRGVDLSARIHRRWEVQGRTLSFPRERGRGWFKKGKNRVLVLVSRGEGLFPLRKVRILSGL